MAGRGRREAPASDMVLRFLMRLWAGDTFQVEGGELVLVRVGTGERFAVPVGLLDELEYGRKWVRAVEPGQRVRLTSAGREALRRFLARVKPNERAARNGVGDVLVLRGAR